MCLSAGRNDQRRYRLVARVEFSGADSDSRLNVDTGLNASIGNGTAPSQQISYDVGLVPNSCLEVCMCFIYCLKTLLTFVFKYWAYSYYINFIVYSIVKFTY